MVGAGEQNELEGVPAPGDVIVDKYRVDRILGMGGMGCVVAATHLTLDQPVAVKFLLNKAARNPKNVMRFQREAQAAAKIKSDHVAKVSDVGTLPNGTPYMVMEYLDGHDLSERLTRVGRIAADEAVRYVLQACEALAEAHNAGIIHRDLKPANLFLASAADGSVRVKVLDFGISKIVAEPGSSKEDLTKTSALMGSPLYMSPEQMMSAKAADGRADIWALGCILFELISGQPPFIGNTLPEICSRILTAPPTKLSHLVSVPPGLELVVERTLNKAPEQRFQNLAELANALYPFGGELAARSAMIVCRVLGAAHLAPASSELPALSQPISGAHSGQPTSGAHPISGASASGGYPRAPTPVPMPYPPSAHSTPHGARDSSPQPAQPSFAQSYPQAFAQSYPQPGMVSYPQGATTSQNQPAPMIPGTSIPSASIPSASIPSASIPRAPVTARAPGFGSDPTTRSAVAVSPAMHQGASTGAPVAQTMSEDYGRRSRAPLFIGLGVVGALVVVGLVAGFTFRDSILGDKAAASAAQPAPSISAAAPLDETTNKPSKPEESAPVKPAPDAKPEATDMVKTPGPRVDPRPEPKIDVPKIDPHPAPMPKIDPKPEPPPPPVPKPRGKEGDDQFN